jgi:hypothetical protein
VLRALAMPIGIDLLGIALKLAVAWAVITALTRLIRNPLANRTVAVSARTIAAQSIFNLLERLRDALDSAATVIGGLRISALLALKTTELPLGALCIGEMTVDAASTLLEPIANTIKGLDHVKFRVGGHELLAQPFDVAVDGPIIDIDLVIVGRIHQGIAAFDDARTAGERLQNQEFGHRQGDVGALPGARMTFRIYAELAALERFALRFFVHGALLGCRAAQQYLDAFA